MKKIIVFSTIFFVSLQLSAGVLSTKTYYGPKSGNNCGNKGSLCTLVVSNMQSGPDAVVTLELSPDYKTLTYTITNDQISYLPPDVLSQLQQGTFIQTQVFVLPQDVTTQLGYPGGSIEIPIGNSPVTIIQNGYKVTFNVIAS